MNGILDAFAHNAFLQNALWSGLLASVASGVVGSYVVARRISYIAGAISHCVLGGIGAALWLRTVAGWRWASPLGGALAAALLAALVIGWVSLRAKQREDTVIGALWAIGMASGILFIARTPGYHEDLLGYLFGNILMVSPRDLWLITGLDAVVIAVALLFYHQFQAVCFDGEFARLRGVRVELHYLLLLVLTALTVVLLVTVVGVVLVIALLTLPAAVGGQFSRTLWQMMGGGVVCSALFTAGGLALSYGANLPSGAMIVLLAGLVYFLVSLRRLYPRRALVLRRNRCGETRRGT